MTQNAQPTAQQRARLAALLKRSPQKSTDRGQVLAQTHAALMLEGAERLEALVQALGNERVIVPVTLESTPTHLGLQETDDTYSPRFDETTHFCSTNVDPEANDAQLGADRTQDMSMTAIHTQAGPALGVWTSVSDLKAFAPHARPMPIPAWKMALAALADVGGHLIVNPVSTDNKQSNIDVDNQTEMGAAGILIPRPATAALAQGDSWLPAWRDEDLKERIRQLAGPQAVGIEIVPGEGVSTVVRVKVASTGQGRPPSEVLAMLNRLARDARLITACDQIVMTPVPVWKV